MKTKAGPDTGIGLLSLYSRQVNYRFYFSAVTYGRTIYGSDAGTSRRDERQRSYRRPGHMYRSKGSLALILPTAWAHSAYMAADGHTFRSAHVTGAPQLHHTLQRLHR